MMEAIAHALETRHRTIPQKPHALMAVWEAEVRYITRNIGFTLHQLFCRDPSPVAMPTHAMTVDP
jgi:hypothetical protein